MSPELAALCCFSRVSSSQTYYHPAFPTPLFSSDSKESPCETTFPGLILQSCLEDEDEKYGLGFLSGPSRDVITCQIIIVKRSIFLSSQLSKIDTFLCITIFKKGANRQRLTKNREGFRDSSIYELANVMKLDTKSSEYP